MIQVANYKLRQVNRVGAGAHLTKEYEMKKKAITENSQDVDKWIKQTQDEYYTTLSKTKIAMSHIKQPM